MKGFHMVAFTLLIIGGLNWLLRVFGVDLETWGLPMIVVQIVYVLVGVSALSLAFTHKKNCKICGAGKNMSTPMG